MVPNHQPVNIFGQILSSMTFEDAAACRWISVGITCSTISGAVDLSLPPNLKYPDETMVDVGKFHIIGTN